MSFVMENKSSNKIKPVTLFGHGVKNDPDIDIILEQEPYDNFLKKLLHVRYRIGGAKYSVKSIGQLRYKLRFVHTKFTGSSDILILSPNKISELATRNVATRVDMPELSFELDCRMEAKTFLYPKQKATLTLFIAAYATDPHIIF